MKTHIRLSCIVTLAFALSACMAQTAPGDTELSADALQRQADDNCVVYYDFDGSEGDIHDQENWANELLNLNEAGNAQVVVNGRDMRITFATGYDPVEPDGEMPEGVSKGTECFAPAEASLAD